MNNRIFKNATSLLLMLIMLFSVFVQSVAAQESNPTPTPQPETINELENKSHQLTQFGTGGALEATQEQVDYWMEQEKLNPFVDSIEASIASTSWHYLDPFTHYAQTAHNGNSNTCGIASVRMVHHWHRGWAPTQATIINSSQVTLHADGTYLSDLISYLSANSIPGFSASHNSNQTTMRTRLTNTISSHNSAPIIGLRGNTSEGFPRNTGNHFVVGYSVFGTGTNFALCDPAGTGSLRWYDVTVATLYTAYNNVNIGFSYK